MLLHKDSVELDENKNKLNGPQIGLISHRRARPNYLWPSIVDSTTQILSRFYKVLEP
jgi:hypothetical protein